MKVNTEFCPNLINDIKIQDSQGNECKGFDWDGTKITEVFSEDCSAKKTFLCERPKNNCFEENTQIYGFDLPNSPTTEDNLKSCQKKCDQTQDCNYWMWNKITFKCHLKSEKRTDGNWMVSNPVMITGAKHCFKCSELGYDYEGNDLILELETSSAIDCQINCQRNNDCKYWAWAPASKCSLKTAKDESRKISKTGMYFGPKYC